MNMFSDLESILEHYRAKADVLGIILVGSASRSYCDELSDYDIEVIVRDCYYASLKNEERLVVNEHNGIKIECLILPEHDFSAKRNSPADIDHWPYEECVLLYDSSGFLVKELPLIIAIPDGVRESRLKLHYFEFLFAAKRMRRLLQRGDELNARLAASHSAFAAIKLVFILHNRWPPVFWWASQNLAQVSGIQPQLKSILGDILRHPNAVVADKLIREIDRSLIEAGLTYPLRKSALTAEVAGAEFRPFREKYGMI